MKIIPDASLKHLGNYDLVDKLRAEYGEKVAMISIVSAGECKMCAASGDDVVALGKSVLKNERGIVCPPLSIPHPYRGLPIYSSS